MEVVDAGAEGSESRLQPVNLPNPLPTRPLHAGPAKAGTPNAALVVVVDDAGAVYPVRIDPTFSDANWISMGGFPGTNGGAVLAAVVDGSGNLYIGGSFFDVVGDAPATNIAKWNGSSWSALGSGISGHVYALAVSGTDLYVGGDFGFAGGKVSTYAARAILTVAGGRFGSPAYSPATGLSFTFRDATAGFPYQIQTSPSLAVGSWTDLTNFNYSGPIVIDDPSATATPKRFYRAVTHDRGHTRPGGRLSSKLVDVVARATSRTESVSENVGQASSLPVDEASLPRLSGGRMPPEPANKMSAPHFQTDTGTATDSGADTHRYYRLITPRQP